MEYIEILAMIEAAILFVGISWLTKAWQDGKKLCTMQKELFDYAVEANKDGKLTDGEYNTIMDMIASVMKQGKIFFDDLENIKKYIEGLTKAKGN